MLKDESTFIKRLQSNKFKEASFSELINLYQERLYWHIRKIVLTHENANDVLQNTFIRVFKSIDGFKSQSSLATWMYRIAYNESIRYLEKSKRTISVSEAQLNSSLITELAGDEYFDGEEAQVLLHNVLLSLPEKERHIFNMKYYDDLKFREISELINMKEGTVKSLYYKSVKHIKENISNFQLSVKSKV
jgi:RNA polymerase sigma-70 factor (ECF subfamily)